MRSMHRRSTLVVTSLPDSPLEQRGFELVVPPRPAARRIQTLWIGME